MSKDKSLKMSLDRPKTLYGVKIEKLPVGRYLDAMRSITDPVNTILETMYPGKSMSEIMEQLSGTSPGDFRKNILNVLLAAPTAMCEIIGTVLKIPAERLTGEGEDALSLNELVEVLLAFWEKNDLSDFFANGRTLIQRMTARQPATGSSDGTPSD